MFDSLSEKLQATLSGLRGRGVLSEEDVTRSLREIRLALLEADVNFKVVKQFTDAVRERCLGADVIGRLNPGQQVVAIVAEELTAMMGGESAGVSFASRPPTVILMAGLQGSGKTTAAAKLARMLRVEHHSSVALAACDVHRPAAVEQLGTRRRAGRRHGLPAGRRPPGGRDRKLGARACPHRRQGCADRRHGRTPARRRRADGRARGDHATPPRRTRSCSWSTR